MGIIEPDIIFQVNSEIVLEAFGLDNFLIQYNDEFKNSNRCAIYFSSNDIYYPNTEDAFLNKIIKKDFYEWYGTRLIGFYKHIFVRDIKKQWYLDGINSRINSPDLLYKFLKHETEDYFVTTIGSSAGGYAAVLYGSLLNAEKTLSFNGQFELTSLLKTSNQFIDPIVFNKASTDECKYYQLKSFINNKVDIYYFSSLYSKLDRVQYDYINDCLSVKSVLFKTSHHGIPFVKSALHRVVNMDKVEISKLVNTIHNPILFSVKHGGFIKTFVYLYQQIKNKISRFFSVKI